MSQWINLEGALETNDVTKSDVKKVSLRTLPNVKMMKIKNDANDRINTTNIDLTFSSIKLSLKLSLKLPEIKWEKVIILRLLLMPRAWRVVLVCRHFISVSVIINYTNMAATSHVKLGFLKSKVNFCWIWTLPWKKTLCCINLAMQLERRRVGGFPCLFWK